MRLRAVLVALAALLLVSGAVGVAGAQTSQDRDSDGYEDAADACPYHAGVGDHDGCPGPYVVHSKVVKPKRHVKRVRHFHPDAHPSPSEVYKIERLEQERWGGPSIRNRVYCESRNLWNATNGQYHGLLQIGSWWSYAWSQTPRDVRIKRVVTRRMPVYKVKVYDTGKRTKTRIRSRRQRVSRIKKGHLPSGADAYHGWAAIRVGQRAVSGDGPSTSWSCGL